MTEENTKSSPVIPDEFVKVIRDFVSDLKTTFPEYVNFIDKWWKGPEKFANIEDETERLIIYEASEKKSLYMLFEFCSKKLPPRFFDILYQNEDIFKEDSQVDTEFLPKLHFRNLWQCDISAKTRETMWKYLQLLMFSVVGTMRNQEAFGDTAKLFESINGEEFKSKLEETLGQMQGLFDLSSNDTSAGGVPGFGANIGNLAAGLQAGDLPNAEQLNDHITSMFGGKIGALAREIAEETVGNMGDIFDDATDVKSVFSSLMGNPTKLTSLVQNIGGKLESKLKSGEMKESEMLAEAAEMVNKMKTMPGMGNLQSMLQKMGMGGLGKVNTNAMEAQLNQRMKNAKMKERMKAKAETNAMMKAMKEQTDAQLKQTTNPSSINDEELIKLFSSGEKMERTPRGSNPQKSGSNNKKKKGKK
jgi:hypothetical protein